MKVIKYNYLLIVITMWLLLALVLPVVSFAEMTASLAWSDDDGQQEQIYFSRYTDGFWHSPVQLTESDSLDYFPSTGQGENGTTWVVWSSKQNNSIVLMYSVESGNGWTEPAMIDSGMLSNTAVSLVVDEQNVPWIVWAGFDGNDDEVFWSRWEDGQWEQPERVTIANDVPDILPVLSMDVHGVMTVRWQSFNGEKYVAVSRSYVDGGWQEGYSIKRKMALQINGEREFIPYPQLPAFVTDPAKAKMHARQF